MEQLQYINIAMDEKFSGKEATECKSGNVSEYPKKGNDLEIAPPNGIKTIYESTVAIYTGKEDTEWVFNITGMSSGTFETQQTKRPKFKINPGEEYFLQIFSTNGHFVTCCTFQTGKNISHLGGHIQVGPQSINFPEGALSLDSRISISECNTVHKDADGISSVVDFQSSISKFSKMVECELQSYCTSEGKKEVVVKVEYWDGESWVHECDASMQENGMVRFETMHFTPFRITEFIARIFPARPYFMFLLYEKENNNFIIAICRTSTLKRDATTQMATVQLGRTMTPIRMVPLRARQGEEFSFQLTILNNEGSTVFEETKNIEILGEEWQQEIIQLDSSHSDTKPLKLKIQRKGKVIGNQECNFNFDAPNVRDGVQIECLIVKQESNNHNYNIAECYENLAFAESSVGN